MEGWYSMKCNLTWKLKATKLHRFYFQLVPSTPHIEGIESGLLPTPKVMEAPSASWENRKADSKYKPGVTLTDLKVWGMLPTPTAMDSTNATATMKSTQVKEGSMHSVTLTRAMAMGMLPTPIAGDWKGQLRSDGTANMLSGKMALLHKQGMLPTPAASDEKMHWKTENWKGDDLGSHINEMLGTRSHLSPQFVLEMMGFPTDWTLLPFLNGETSQLKQEEMQ
jgi:hypothetical protein